ncbi:MAG TPA: NAD-dependent epimerase/dehydratase family protein [Gemmatimonadales bacterium]|nr:NAD-dependent epimerase/dehydratase family protein [Gemmatimonadales bacterium]
MKVLVTGGTGFTGSALCQRLAREGHTVVSLDQKAGIFDDELRELGVQLVQGSVTDRPLVERLTAGCERVYHLASAWRAVSLPDSEYYNVNVNGTRWVMEAALRHGVARVVHCSTCGVHGNPQQSPADETAPIAPEDIYQRTKWAGEQVVHEFLDRGLWVTIIRSTSHYGPGDPERILHVYRRVARGHFTFLGPGTAHFHLLYIDNLLDAFQLAAVTDTARGGTYLIGDERSLSIRDLVLAIAESLGTTVKIRHLPFWPAYMVGAAVEFACRPFGIQPPVFRRRLNWFRFNRSFDIGKARRELGYVPRVDIPTGLRLTGEWYRARGLI